MSEASEIALDGILVSKLWNLRSQELACYAEKKEVPFFKKNNLIRKKIGYRKHDS